MTRYRSQKFQMRKTLFEKYRTTTKAERIKMRQEMEELMKTECFQKWVEWAYRRQSKECFYCDNRIQLKKRKSYHIEHRIPIYYGGTNDFSNLVLACPECNRAKGTQQLERRKAYLIRLNRLREERGSALALYL